MDWRDLLDTGALRYGVPTAEKERLARQRSLPGAPLDLTADQAAADRYAAAYLFGLEWPRLSKAVEPALTGFKVLTGTDPILQSYATAGLSQARTDVENWRNRRYAINTNPTPWEDYRSAEAEEIRKRGPRGKRPTAMVQIEALEE